MGAKLTPKVLELLPYYSWIVDRFHLSTRAEQRRLHGREPDLRWLEDRLVPLGFRIVLCTRRDDTFAAARAERVSVSGKPDQYDDLTIFVREQALLRELAATSILPVLDLDVSDDDVPAAAGRIADWLEATGGLSSPWGVAASTAG